MERGERGAGVEEGLRVPFLLFHGGAEGQVGD